jgi:Spy/CpxP family protein refolding chaperone
LGGRMKGIRLFALLAALLVLGAPTASAQSGTPPQGQAQGRGRQMEMLMQGITLTDAQKASVDSIVQAYRAQMPQTPPGTPPDSATRAKRMEVMQKQTADIRAVLTKEQQAIFDKNVETVRQQMGRPRP